MTPQTLSTPPAATATTRATATRIGAGLGLASVVLMMAGLALEGPADALHTNPVDDIVGYYTGDGLATKFTGGLIDSLGILLFLPFVAMVVSRLRRPGVAGDLLAPTAQMAGAAYVVLCLAPGQAAGAAALWLGRTGPADPSAVLALNDLRVFSYFLALLCLATFLVAAGAGGSVSGGLARWMAWSAVGIGVALAIGVAVAQTGLADIASLLALAWVVVVSIGLLRRPEQGNDGSAAAPQHV
jgi:hypothetical protein